MTAMVHLLFVYGTLRSEFDNEYALLLRAEAEFVGPATVPGSIYRVEHYPAWKPEPAGIVRGELYRLTNPERTLAALDDYEGEDFERVLVNTPEPAWIYRYNGAAPAQSRIESGDFRA
jgi:gamma-glutamylcyclotransferase (GGCT)/AIG2-like uncharacterized protein YtfP